MPHRRRTRWRAWWAGVDPGLLRLEFAAIAVTAVLLAVGVMAVVRATLAPGEPLTIVLFAGVLAMFANVAVNEPTVARRRTTTALMVVPAAVTTVVGALLAPHRVLADVVFVAVMVCAVWARRFGPRADALGMAAFVPFFSTQFFGVKPEQVPWLLGSVVVGIASTVLVRGFLVPDRPAAVLRRVVRAFRGRGHALVAAVDAVLVAVVETPPDRAREERVLTALLRARTRLHSTALQVEDVLDRLPDHGDGSGDPTPAVRAFDVELSLERLCVAARHLVTAPDGEDAAYARPPGGLATTRAVLALRQALERLLAALDPASPHDRAQESAAAAAGWVATVGDPVEGVRADVGVGLTQLARAVAGVARVLWSEPLPVGTGRATAPADDPAPDPAGEPPPDPAGRDVTDEGPEPGRPMRITSRAAVQVGVGTALAVVVAEHLAPQRWYWAVLTAFIVFTGTQSRGEVLTRGWLRVLGTVGGVVAGVALAAIVGGSTGWSTVLLFVCLFLALYLSRLSPALLAFWITAVLALLYGILGQFHLGVLVLRVQETAIGAVCGGLAAFLVLPKRTREAVADAVTAAVAAMDAVLAGALDRMAGRVDAGVVHDRTRQMHAALATLRQRVQIEAGPLPRRRSSTQHLLRTLTVVDHYLRAVARLADGIDDPATAARLRPVVDRIRDNLDTVAALLTVGRGRGRRPAALGAVAVRTAAPLATAPDDGDPGDAAREVVELLERADRAVVAVAADLGATTCAVDREGTQSGGVRR